MADLVFVRTSHDRVTATLSEWAGEVLTAISEHGDHRCQDLTSAQASRANLEAALRGRVDCVVFYGHGEADRLLAQEGAAGDPAVLDMDNADALNGHLVYVVACSSAHGLGPSAVRHGARAYFGYDDDFAVVWEGPEVWFKRAANAGLLALLGGPDSAPAPCGEALLIARDTYDDAIRYFARGAGVDDYNRPLALVWLRWNSDCLTLLGDPSATL